MPATRSPEQLEQAFRATEASGATGQGAMRRRLVPDSALDVFTEVRFPSRDWALVVHSSERLEDRDLVLTAGLTCRTSNGRIEVVAGPHTERLLFCTLLADLLSQLTVPDTGPAAALVRRLAAWQRMLSRGLSAGLSPGGADRPVRGAPGDATSDTARYRHGGGPRLGRPSQGTAGHRLSVHVY